MPPTDQDEVLLASAASQVPSWVSDIDKNTSGDTRSQPWKSEHATDNNLIGKDDVIKAVDSDGNRISTTTSLAG
jgi:hypothetical protein